MTECRSPQNQFPSSVLSATVVARRTTTTYSVLSCSATLCLAAPEIRYLMPQQPGSGCGLSLAGIVHGPSELQAI